MGKVAIASLESISPYSQSKFIQAEKKPKEQPDDYEKRCWRQRLHTNEEGNVVIGPMVFKNCLSEAAKFLGRKIPGQRQATYTKHFVSGILVLDKLILPVKADEVAGEWFHVPSDGMRGGGKRVLKCFPVIPHWKGDVTFHVIDDLITEDVFLEHLKEAGKFVGVGRFRPANNGFYGRFQVNKVVWSEG